MIDPNTMTVSQYTPRISNTAPYAPPQFMPQMSMMPSYAPQQMSMMPQNIVQQQPMVQQPVVAPLYDTTAVEQAYKKTSVEKPDGVSQKAWDNASPEMKQKIVDYNVLSEAMQTPWQKAQKQHPILTALATGAMGFGQGMTHQPYLTDFNNTQAALQKASMDMINEQIKPNTLNQKVPLIFIGQDGKPTTVDASGNTVPVLGDIPKNSKIVNQSNIMSPEQLASTAQMMVEMDENGVPKYAPSQIPGRNGRAQAIAAAKEIDPTYNPAQADINYAAAKMGTGQFIKKYNNLDAYHRNFERSADLTLKYSDAVDRSMSPLLNKAIISGKLNIAGDPAATKFVQQVYTTAMEFARIQNPNLTGVALSDNARAEATEIINKWQSDGQIEALLGKDGSMRLDSLNMVETSREKLDELQGRSSGSKPETKNTSGSVNYNAYLKAIGNR